MRRECSGVRVYRLYIFRGTNTHRVRETCALPEGQVEGEDQPQPDIAPGELSEDTLEECALC